MQADTERDLGAKFINACNLDEAMSTLAALGNTAIPVAGATWVMRSKARGETNDKTFVSLSGIEQLNQITWDDHQLSIGSMVTHDALVKAVAGKKDLVCLSQAAGSSANPAVRRMATIGGNICSLGFFASDLVPALACLSAFVEVQSPSATEQIPLLDFLPRRADLSAGQIVTRFVIPRTNNASSHARLLMRKAGEYPMVNLSASIALDDSGKVATACIIVGSVEDQAKRWSGLEKALLGCVLSQTDIKSIASIHLDEFVGRDGVDAPGWYRKRVLPKVAAQAMDTIVSAFGGAT